MERDDLYVSLELPLEIVRYSHALLVVSVTVLKSLSSKSLCGQNVMETTPIGRLGYQLRIFFQSLKACQSTSPLAMTDGLT